VEDLDPIKHLQSLLDDRNKVLEKISGIHSALNSIIKTANAAPPAPEAVLAAANKSSQIPENHLYNRLFQTLHDMQAQIEERVRPLAQQTIEIEVARLREMSKQDQNALVESLARIDQCILSCMERVGEYQKRHSELTRLNERLATLGAEPQPLPDLWPAQDPGEMIRFRLEELRLQGKL
jgi:DNA repair exonuclease SbcCD ATPase subunit